MDTVKTTPIGAPNSNETGNGSGSGVTTLRTYRMIDTHTHILPPYVPD
jgi:hypothetical protein